ncbi:hypothetical protein JCM5350_000499 [Sporobolomyces pararoseus]
MRSTFAAVSVLSLASLAAAQRTYGRFPCTIVNGDGTFSPDQSQCANDNLVAPGAADGSGFQSDGLTPVDPVCTLETETGAYACGIAGATCTTNSNCDNGLCVDGICQGGFTQGCDSTDSNCSGFLYCLSADYETTASNTCGGLGAFCTDFQAVDESNSAFDNYRIGNQFCSSGYCNTLSTNCDVHATNVGDDCSSDPDFKCSQTSEGVALSCNPVTLQCEAATPPSGRARARRNLSARNACPSLSEQRCATAGGFECIDTSSDLENCGACGNDCSSIEGVSAASCSNSVCEIWACADGYVYSADAETCVATI